MQRRGKNSALHDAAAALRILEDQAVKEFDFAVRADAAVKILEIGAAAEGDVLAIVHVLAVGQFVGRSAAAEVGPLFEKFYSPAGLSQRDAGRQTRQPAADHDHAFQRCSLSSRGRSALVR